MEVTNNKYSQFGRCSFDSKEKKFPCVTSNKNMFFIIYPAARIDYKIKHKKFVLVMIFRVDYINE